MLHLYNTLTNKEEEFTPIKEGEVSMYTCGPTVYGRPHIGNYSSFLLADLLRRWLEVSGYAVTHVKNITDVGHLAGDTVADADGEDKVEKQAREEFGEVTHESVIGIARKYEEQYLEDEKELNIKDTQRPRATEYIDQMKEMINSLLEKDFAYATDDGIYFRVTSDLKTPYGTLSGNKLEDLQVGSRVEVNDQKENPADFALWKFCVGHNEQHALRWPSPGKENPDGFPGWHIECSAMSRALLGDQIDIHTGGEDNIFPHHECEIAQSESTTGVSPFVKTWLHKRFIDMGDTKMSKSLGNVLCLPDIKNKGFDPLDLRYYLLSAHYRTNLKFTEKGLEDAHKARRKILEWMSVVASATPVSSAPSSGMSESINEFKEAMDSDLNTPAALADIFAVMNFYYSNPEITEEDLAEYNQFITMVRNTFGCFDLEEAGDIPQQVLDLAQKRLDARANKDFAASDSLRDEIQGLGFEVKDTGEGQKIIKL